MFQVFIVNGYGVPKDIFNDDNYHFYLNMVFNRIWDISHLQQEYYKTVRPHQVVVSANMNVLIVFSGGPTDCFPPYRRTEAGEMKKLFSKIIQRDSVRNVTKHWKITSQTKALTTVENLVYGREWISKHTSPFGYSSGRGEFKKSPLGRGVGVGSELRVCYFCESTRFERSRVLCKKVFPKSWNPSVIPIDFDISPQRYLSEKLLKAREEKALQYELWALKSLQNLKAWRKVYQERIEFLRKAGPKAHHKAVKEWWEKRLLNLRIPS